MGHRPHEQPGHAVAAAIVGARPLATVPPAKLVPWAPGVFAARLRAGVRLASGRVTGQTDRVVHLFPIPPSTAPMPQRLRAYCGTVIEPGQADLIPVVGAGMPCVACIVEAPASTP